MLTGENESADNSLWCGGLGKIMLPNAWMNFCISIVVDRQSSYWEWPCMYLWVIHPTLPRRQALTFSPLATSGSTVTALLIPLRSPSALIQSALVIKEWFYRLCELIVEVRFLNMPAKRKVDRNRKYAGEWMLWLVEAVPWMYQACKSPVNRPLIIGNVYAPVNADNRKLEA